MPGFSKIQAPEPWIFENRSFRGLVFSKIRAPGCLGFPKSKLLGAWIWKNPRSRSLYFLKSSFRKHEFHEISMEKPAFMSPGTLHKEPPNIEQLSLKVGQLPALGRKKPEENTEGRCEQTKQLLFREVSCYTQEVSLHGDIPGYDQKLSKYCCWTMSGGPR